MVMCMKAISKMVLLMDMGCRSRGTSWHLLRLFILENGLMV
jgi:hypothetical protein